MSDSSSSGSCSCLEFVLTMLVIWAVWFGLPTPWGTYNIDIIPPAIREVSGQ